MISQKYKGLLLTLELFFGILVPVFCLWVDPGIFTGDPNMFFRITFFESQIFWYCLIGINIITLIIYLIFGEKIGYAAGFLVGIFATGAACSFLIDIMLFLALVLLGFPFITFDPIMFPTVLLFNILIDVLIVLLCVYMPFYICFIYSRHCYRLFRSATKTIEPTILTLTILLGLLFAIGVPLAIQWRNSQVVTQAMYDITTGNDKTAVVGTEKLKTAFWCASFCQHKLWNAWENTNESHRKMLINQAYKEVTGETIEDRIRRYDD